MFESETELSLSLLGPIYMKNSCLGFFLNVETDMAWSVLHVAQSVGV